ncbi:paternally-expressed gene 3 protein isoform X2 [Moschus berezovskii]|nr:paternally-expressed gene 3 protein isoform X2 [Moschus berezovskii]
MLPPKSLSATKPKKSWAPNLYELDSDLSEPDAVPGEGATDSEFFHQRFRNFLYVEFIGPRKTLLKLRNLCLDWLQPEIHTKEEIIEVLVLEQYLTILPEKIKPWVHAKKPDNCEKLVALLENYEEMYEPEDDNSSDTHSEGGMSGRATESPPPRPALPCCSDRERDWDQEWERERQRGRARERERRRGRGRDVDSRDRWPSVRSPRSRFHQRDLALPLAERAKEREHRRRDSLLDLDARSEEAALYQDMVALTEDRKLQNPIQDNMENYRKLLSLGVQLAEDDGNSHMTQGHSVRSKRSAYPSTSRGLKTAPETKKSAHRRGICEAESSHGVIMEKFIKDVARSSRSGRAREPSERPHRLSRRPGGDWKEASFSRREAGASERGPEGGAFGGGGFSCSSDLVSKKRALERKRRYHFDAEGQGPVHDPRGGARKRPFECGGEARRAAKAAGASSLSAPPVALSQPLDLGAMPYVCDECGRSFAVISEFVEHQIVHTRESLYEYGESFIHSAAVSEAQSRPAGARRSEGAQATGNGTGLAEHRRGQAREHLGGSGDEEQDEPFLPSPTFSELQKMYGKDKFYECKVCKETFLHSSALIEHQKIHSHEEREKERSTGAVRRTPMLGELQRACGKEKRYECKVCGETFHHSAALREHQKTHGRGSPSDGRARAFEETFIPSQSLKRRQKTYSKEKLYDFREGGDAFGRSSDFMEHQKIHSRKSYFDSRGYEKPLFHSMSMPSSQKSHTITRPPEDEDEEKAFTASSNPEDGQEARAYERSAYERAILHSLAAFRPPRGLREDGEPSTYLSGLRDPPQKTPAWESPYTGGRHSFLRSSVFYRASRPAPLDHLAGEGPSGWKRDGEASSPSSDGRQHQKARAKKKNIERKNYDTSMIHTLRFGEPQTFRPRERFYECPECGEFFVHSSELAEHQKIHNRKKLSGSKNYLRSVLRSLTSTDPQTSYQGQSMQMGYAQEAAQTSYAELAAQTSYAELAAQTSYAEEPAQTSYAKAPAKASYTEEPAQTSCIEEPAQTSYTDPAAETSYTEEPAQTNYTEEPAEASYTEEPAQTSCIEEPDQTSYTDPAAETSYTEEPAQTNYTEEPTEANYTEELAQTSYTDPAAETSYTEEPAQTNYTKEPAEASYTEEPAQTSCIKEPAQTSYTEESAQTNYIEESADASYSEEPAQTSCIEEPAQTSYTDPAAETSYTEEPAQTNYTEEPADASYTEEPAQTSCIEEPAQTSYTDPAAEAGYTEEPAEAGYSEEPAQTSYAKEPAQTSYSEEPDQTSYTDPAAQTSYTEEPAQTSYTEEPAQTSYTEEPAQTSYTEEPAQTSYTEEPAEARYTEKPSQTSYAEEPAQTSYTEEPAEARYTEKPSQTSYAEEPAQTSYSEEPAQASYSEEPAQTSYSEEPDQTSYSEEPDQTSYSEEPDQTSYSEEPDQTSYSEEPAQTRYAEEPDQTSYAEEPAQSSYAEEPAQSSYAEEPAQTRYAEEPAQTSYAEEPAQTSYAEEPAQTSYAEEPAQTSYSEEPAQSTYAEEPAQTRYAEESLAETSYAELVAQISYAELAAPTSYAELAVETSYFEPPAQTNYTEPAETNYAEPAAQVSFDEPPVEASYADLAAEISYAELAAETSYADLAAQISYDEPPAETSYAELAAQISYSEPADQTSYAELAAQTSYSEPLAQTSYAELTSETSYCEQPVLNECKECGECFATVEDLGRHRKIYAGEKFHDGKLFGESVMPDLGLDGSPEEEPEEQEEPEDSIYGCKDCGLGFADREDLRDHQKVHGREYLVDTRQYTHPAVHTPPVSEYQKDCLGEQLYECPACGESFVHSSFLFEHQKVHEQDQFYGHRRYEPFMQPLIASPRRPQAPQKSAPTGVGPQCQVCGLDFIHPSVLSEHARGHAGEGLPDQGQGGTGAAGPGPAPTEPQRDPGEEQRYECETCGESFPSQADLQEHMRVHEKGEPYDYGAAFVHTSFLTEPPKRDWPFYECKDCGKSFIHSTILTKHQKLHLQEEGAAAAAAATAQEAEANVLVPREVLRIQGSNVEAAEPEVEAAEPEVEAAEPEVEAAEPLGEAEGPEWEAAEPSGEAEQPHAEAEQPDMDADEPDGAGIEDPEERAEEPESDADEPDGAGIEDPEEEGEEQEIQVEEPYYDCGECGETFPSGAAYAEHLREHASLVILEPAGFYGEGAGGPEGGRPDDELFKCDVCGQLFSDRLSLARHQNTHTG